MWQIFATFKVRVSFRVPDRIRSDTITKGRFAFIVCPLPPSENRRRMASLKGAVSQAAR